VSDARTVVASTSAVTKFRNSSLAPCQLRHMFAARKASFNGCSEPGSICGLMPSAAPCYSGGPGMRCAKTRSCAARLDLPQRIDLAAEVPPQLP
jgi:hypothetical protein